MLPEELPSEKFAETKDVAELRSFLEDEYRVRYVSASLGELQILPDAVLAVHGRELPCTQSFLEKLSGEFGMPLAYAYDIDLDLFRYNFDQRKRIRDHAMQLCLIDGRAVGLAPAEYRPARTLDMLDAWTALDQPQWRIRSASLSDRSAEIDLVSEELVLEPQPGDVIRVGIRMANSETGEGGFKASMFTHRLACANGAVMSDTLGTVRWNYDKRVTYGTGIRKCAQSLVKLGQRCDQLQNVYAAAVDLPMLEEDFTRLWRRIRSAGNFTPEGADNVLGISGDERRAIAAAVAHRTLVKEPAQPSPWDIFTIHNRVTAAARTLPMARRSRLERIGGDVLSHYSNN